MQFLKKYRDLVIAFIILIPFTCPIYKWAFSPRESTVIRVDKVLPKVVVADACTKGGVKCVSDVLLVLGEINKGTLDALDHFSTKNEAFRPTIACFDSPGGDVLDAFQLAKKLTSFKLGTCLAEEYRMKDGSGIILDKPMCGSACNYVLLASNYRVAMGKEVNFITHSVGLPVSTCFCDFMIEGSIFQHYWLDNFVGNQSNPDKEKHLEFIEFGKAIPNASKHKLTFEELERFAIFNKWIK